MENLELIKLEQEPKIIHTLKETGASVTKRLHELNIDNLIATEETAQYLKKLRAELTKEAKLFEEQRIIVKDAILAPYKDFEEVYKEEIIKKYRLADELLKSKINDFEMSIKTNKRNNLIAYFNEISEMEQIDWLHFDRLNIEVNLSVTEKKYKEQILEITSKIVSDLDLIKTDEYSAEILVEYKKTLNASKAIREVRERKEAEKQEKIRIQAERTQKRVSQLHSLSFVFHDLTKTYNNVLNEQIMISYSDVENMTDIEWIKAYSELETAVKNEQKETVKPLEAPKEVPANCNNKTEQKPEENHIKKFRASFEIIDTYERLKLLQEFLKSNNYEYKSL